MQLAFFLSIKILDLNKQYYILLFQIAPIVPHFIFQFKALTIENALRPL